jgi:hypothetical protein
MCLTYDSLCYPWTCLVYSSLCCPWTFCFIAACAVPGHVWSTTAVSLGVSFLYQPVLYPDRVCSTAFWASLDMSLFLPIQQPVLSGVWPLVLHLDAHYLFNRSLCCARRCPANSSFVASRRVSLHELLCCTWINFRIVPLMFEISFRLYSVRYKLNLLPLILSIS